MADTDQQQEIHMPNGDVLQFPSGMADDAIRSAIQTHYGQTTGGTGLMNYGSQFVEGMPIFGPLAQKNYAAVQAALPSSMTGESPDSTFIGRYNRALTNNEAQRDAFAKANPGPSTALKLTGGAAAAVPAVMMAPAAFGVGAETLAGAAGTGALTGGAISGTDAALRNQPIIPGIATGAVTGAAFPALGRGIGSLSSRIASFMSGANNPLSGIDPLALKWAASALKADGLTTDTAINDAFQKLGPKGFLAEYGANLKGRASAVAALPGEGKQAIFDGFDGRAGEARDDIEQSATNAFGPRVNIAQLTAQREASKKAAADPLYQQWRNLDIPMTPELAAIAQLPSVKAAMPAAAKMAGDEQQPILNAATGGPTAQTWDYIKRAMDDQARGAGFGTNQARIATGISNRIRDAIDNHPDPNVAGVWQAARQAYAAPSQIQEAQEAGQTVFSRNVRTDDLTDQFQNYSLPQQHAFIQGARDQVSQTMDATRRGDTTVRNMFMAPANQQKLSLLVGQQKADALTQDMEQFATHADNRSFVAYNSQTAPRQASMQLLTPDPSQTLVARLRTAYSPHITPLSLVPKGFENMAAGRQEAQYENARNDLAPLLMSQGQDAVRVAKALADYSKRSGSTADIASQAGMAIAGQIANPQIRDLYQ